MNEQEQQIAIAEACGWRYVTNRPHFNYVLLPAWKDVDGVGVCVGKHLSKEQAFRALLSDNETGIVIPDYLHDRQAMGDAILALPLSGRYRFCDYVVSLANKRLGQEFKPTRRHWEKAMLAFEIWPEAFLRAIGKWKDGLNQTNTVEW